jgi:hypothetical protein
VKQKYSNVVGIHFVSPVTGKNMDQLMTNIKQVVAKQVCTSLPTSVTDT